jgi:NAD(P)-dependent dehydrogenase (short-subunit alcohol dehydrogenase family)
MKTEQTVALVTGANRGIGLEVTRQLAQKGMTVIMGTRSLEKGEGASPASNAGASVARQAAMQELGKVTPYQLDVTDSDSITNLAKWVDRQFGYLDILVNNAGILYDTWQQASTADLKQVRQAIATNTLGAWQMCHSDLKS